MATRGRIRRRRAETGATDIGYGGEGSRQEQRTSAIWRRRAETGATDIAAMLLEPSDSLRDFPSTRAARIGKEAYGRGE